jgi:hypothetical protein
MIFGDTARMHSFQSIRPLLERWGSLKQQFPSEWTGEIALPSVLEAFYLEVGPWGETRHEQVGPVGLTIDAGGNPVCVPPLYKLWGMQNGYRWHGLSGERLTDWKDDWLVIAEQGGDPFILEISTGHVLFDMHGSGRWSPKYFAKDLIQALGSIATVANALSDLGDEAFDDDTLELKPQSRQFVRSALARFLGGDEKDASAALHAWRWYE